ncbi:hypothetical protein BDN72DRAFT_494054 [Pluteus cervinus]|uniref:Uncharacterized protein n=1 Tax=Pluteus cervinus TaxID=181527 RepID=A0ACD3B077_9AGAR|nr:hypothetical protein BDN72DRAFT_494054 [Pluteus cervinus]
MATTTDEDLYMQQIIQHIAALERQEQEHLESSPEFNVAQWRAGTLNLWDGSSTATGFTASKKPPVELPVDILSLIFTFALHAEQTLRLTYKSSFHLPIQLSSVCRDWRYAAFETSELWSRICLQLAQPHPLLVNSQFVTDNEVESASGRVDSQRMLVSTWLARSGSRPITGYITWSHPTNSQSNGPYSTKPEDYHHPVLAILAQRSHQWGDMSFSIPMTAYPANFSPRALQNLSELKALNIDTTDSRVYNTVGEFTMFQGAFNLQSLQVVNLSPRLFTFPWAKLDDIPLMASSVDESLHILHEASTITSAQFALYCVSFPPNLAAPPGPPTPLPPPPPAQPPAGLGQPAPAPPQPLDLAWFSHETLESLYITSPDENNLNLYQFFRSFIAPNLKKLQITNITPLSSDFASDLKAFLTHPPHLHQSAVLTNNTLTSLSIRRTPLDPAKFLDCLEFLEGLEQLEIIPSDTTPLTADFFTKMTVIPNSGERIYCPNLTIFKAALHDDNCANALSGMLTSRWRSHWLDQYDQQLEDVVVLDEDEETNGDWNTHKRLRKISLSITSFEETPILFQRIEELFLSGMRIELVHAP